MKQKEIENLTENQQKVIKVLCNLSERERIILQSRFCSNQTLEEIATKVLKVTVERVRQIEEGALQKITEVFI